MNQGRSRTIHSSFVAKRQFDERQTALLRHRCGHVTARVTRVIPSEEVMAATRAVETQIGAKISPTYMPLPRVAAEINPGRLTLAAILLNITVKIGDKVELNTRYRDPALSFHPTDNQLCYQSKSLIELAAFQIGAWPRGKGARIISPHTSQGDRNSTTDALQITKHLFV
jgi:hypothetical protein